jgi:5-methylcytosine-specific restriction endonuclease McrA
MLYEQVVRKSNSGSTKWVDSIYYFVESPKTHASYILLKNYYWEQDEDNLKLIANRMKMVGFSRTYLTKVLEATGILCCTYCNKKGLIIELEGMKVANGSKATIDHIVPISKGGDLFNYENLCVACGSCNGKKGDKPVEEFINYKKQ